MVTTPLLTNGSRSSLTIEVDQVDLARITLHLPNLQATIEVIVSGEHLEQLQRQLTAATRQARKDAMRARTIRAEVAS